MRYEPDLPGTRAAVLSSVLAVAVLCTGCASDGVQAQWTDPRYAGRVLSGERVLIVCNAAEVTLRRICEDQLAVRLTALGITPVKTDGQDLGAVPTGPANDKTLAEARSAAAKAIFASNLAPDAAVVSPGPTFGVGVGGFGGYRGGMGAGVGVSAPIGPERVSTAYGADMALTDVATGRLIWSAKVTTAASQDLTMQIGKLVEEGVAAVQKAGML
jgi:hypothetical protein